jgi:membrane fusion protein, multidrug efflux system
MMNIHTSESSKSAGSAERSAGMPAEPGRPKKRGLIWLVLLVGIVGVAGYAVWKAGQPATTAGTGKAATGKTGGGRAGGLGPVPVVIQKVGRSSVPVYLNGLGNVTAYYTVTVKSRVDGQLMNIMFKEGDQVQQGQTLIDIDPRPYQVQLQLAEATLAKDSATLANAKLDLERYRGALATDAIPKQQFDTQAALVAQLEGTIRQDQANIENAKLQITYAHITAPITGVVGLRLVDPGNIVHANDPNGMVVITQLQPISALFTIPEDSLPQVTQKLRAGVKLPVEAFNRDNTKKLATGVLVTLDNQIDASTGTSKLKAVFDNKDNALFPQQFVNIRLLVDTLTNQMVVPNVAIQNGQQGAFVYVVDEDSKVHLKPVQVGITTDTVSDILNGISDKDSVVVDGTDRLVEGAVVRVRKPGELDNPDGGAAGRGGKGRGRGGKKGGGDGNSDGAAKSDVAAQPDGGASSGGAKKGDGSFKRGDGSFKRGDGSPKKGDGGGSQ